MVDAAICATRKLAQQRLAIGASVRPIGCGLLTITRCLLTISRSERPRLARRGAVGRRTPALLGGA